MRCAQALLSIDALLDGELPARQGRRVVQHALRCQQCRGRLVRAVRVLELCRQLGQALPGQR